MKEIDKLKALELYYKHIKYIDGFWLIDNKLSTELEVRQYIKANWNMLEKDITDCLSELRLGNMGCFVDIENLFQNNIKQLMKKSTGKSKYFQSLDELYPNNKFREIMNYYLFSEDCYCFIFVGYGQTGKTTFVSLMARILNEAYFGRANVNLLKNSHGTAILEGKKLFEVAEAQDLDLDTANMLKSIITNDEIYINPKFQLPRTIKPHTKLIMTCNNVPRFKVTDDGIIRRFITIKMDNKIKKQTKNFVELIENDIPNIIKEAYENKFNIENFANEQYLFFENDPQWGFGYGIEPTTSYFGSNEYEKYVTMCKSLGYKHRNKMNFDKFIELAKIYGERLQCDITSKGYLAQIGLTLLSDSDNVDSIF